jgi:hypothetical protein
MKTNSGNNTNNSGTSVREYQGHGTTSYTNRCRAGFSFVSFNQLNHHFVGGYASSQTNKCIKKKKIQKKSLELAFYLTLDL